MLRGYDDGPDDALASLPDYGARELRAIVLREQVVDLTDLVFRRLPIAVSGRLTGEAVLEIAGLVAEALAWNDDERERQIAALGRIALERHGIDLGDRLANAGEGGGPDRTEFRAS